MMFADSTLAARLEHADARRSLEFVRAGAALHPETESAWLALGDGYAIFAGAGSPLNKTIGFGIAPRDGEEQLQTLEEFYHSRGTLPAIDLAPYAGAALLEALARRRYAPRYFLNVLAAETGTLRIGGPATGAVRVRRAAPEEASLWSRAVAAGFADGEAVTDEDLRLFTTQFHGATSHAYLAEMEGRIAGGGFMAVSDGVALLGATSVLPEFRKMGIHAALLRERLGDATALGCDIVMSSASPGSPSQRNLERHGLSVMYTKALMQVPSHTMRS